MDNKTILFIGYWGANDGLTSATIIPHLKILSELESVSKIIFCSIERENHTEFNIDIPKVNHKPLYPIFNRVPIINKISDFIFFPKKIAEICKQYSVNQIIARGAVAGGLAYKTSVKTKIPFYVESFEPHAEYMLESNVWSKNDIRYRFQTKWEEKQKKYATALMPVAYNFKEELVKAGVESKKIDVIPCCVPVEEFAFNEKDRSIIRKKLNIESDAKVGIYVGKFGGLYYDEESFQLFKNNIEKYHIQIILLTPQVDYAKRKIKEMHISAKNIHVLKVAHSEVPNYLSAADFAYALYRPAPSKKSLSPIKVGEYWANGLPVIITDGIGDDSAIIKETKLGIIWDKGKEVDFAHLFAINRSDCQLLANKFRSFEIVRTIYKKWYSK